MRALVTGGSGFIGSHVVDKLRERGIQVRVYDMIMPKFRDDIEYYQASILDLESLTMAMADVDAVFHLAAVADVKSVYEHPHYSESINVRGTINVLEAARSNKVSRVIYGSTIWVYGDVAEECVDEDTPLHAPSHLYTATKMTSEYYCQAYARLYGLPTTILRYGIPYGPRARDGAVIPIFVSKALQGEPLTIAGDGSQYRKFVYVEDLAEGNALALKGVAANKIYNLDGKERVTIRQIAQTIQDILGKDKVRIETVPGRPGDFGGKEVSSERARRELDWEPRVGLREGIERYIAWYQAREAQRATERSRLDTTLHDFSSPPVTRSVASSP
ncbi:MAG: NAD-dependent epimerase/dehydratase family protein [Candidatus Omnitrophica bacterium]|nr:NAD-dependent epimerase/dehydratase family protein [Candidatus Omnitrophota bacterium]